ncbi:DUF4085 family protein [Brevibacillus sp. B_LB10_24]|uniref:DUF4085 family protein n=1 Tax=Brevibacillus sp. B_LB10_24 TaxID=3380645 RepID=UPI0038B79C72
MKYFTKAWYEKMQVAGFLVFPETREEWEEYIQYCSEEGIDLKKQVQEDLDFRKSDLLKYLPESFHPYIHDYTIRTEYPSEELRQMSERWQKEYRMRMERLALGYKQQYNAVKDKLPAGAVQLHENSLHDAKVISCELASGDRLIMTLDCRGGFHYFTDVKLIFTGVTELALPDKLEGAWWLYDEIYLSDTGFELHVLFDCPLTECKITAKDIWLETGK